jgi:hypothetical protein
MIQIFLLPKMNEIISEVEKQTIIASAKSQYKDSIKSRRVDAVLVFGVIFSGKAPYFSGWASGAAGHWGVVVDGLLHHLVFKIDDRGKPVGVEFEQITFRERWIAEKRATKEEIGSTSLPLEAIKAIGETLILEFGDYRRLYRNCQTFAEIFIQLICDVKCESFSTLSISQLLSFTLLAFPLTTISGTIIHIKQRNFIRYAIQKTKKSLSWEDIVDAEINEEIAKIGLDIDPAKPKCSLM